MTDTETPAPKAKKQATPEQQAGRRATRFVARALARVDGKDGDDKGFKARWDANKADYTGQARKLVRAFKKEGIAMSVTEGGRKGGKGKKAAASQSAEG